MNQILETAFYWIVFAMITSWVLRRFYFTKSSAVLSTLRASACILEISVLLLLLFPWLPGAHGASGWGLVLQGDDIGMTTLAALILFTTITLFLKKPTLSKAGVLSHVAATILFFVIMIRKFPETITMTMGDTAPIFVALLMLTNVIVMLLLWHQLQKQK